MHVKELLHSIDEAKGDYEVYHDSYSSAIAELEPYAEKNGYTLDKEEMAQDIGLGPVKPPEGMYNRFSLTLYKNEKPVRKRLQVQVFGMGEGKYELNMYIL